MHRMSQPPSELLGQPLSLRRGAAVPNRFFKSAMSEALGTPTGAPRPGLATLFRTWAAGGVGLSVTGNVMIDRSALGEPGNVVVEDDRDLDDLRAWAEAGTSAGGHLWMQINHPGKQSPRALSREPVAPSAIPLRKELARFFAPPRALTGAEIEELVARYGRTAAVARDAGFTGVQIHGAHGYLVSQFLSPRHNQREDEWGGSAENRSRFALAVYRSMRAAVGDDFPIGIKMNSADFQRGGFDEDESMEVAAALAEAGMDLVEISGGSYESPAMTGHKVRDSTLQREAYFLEFAERIRSRVDVPLVVTGGFRSAAGMASAVETGATDLVGLARPLAVEPDLPSRILAGEDFHSLVRPLRTGIAAVDRMAVLEVTWYEQQLKRMAAGKAPRPNRGAWSSFMGTVFSRGWQMLRPRRARA